MDKVPDVINGDRRKALQTIVVGGAVASSLALSGKWAKPVIDTVILPAHAQTTNAVASGQGNESSPEDGNGAAPGLEGTTPAPTTTCNTMITNACWDATWAGPEGDRHISQLVVIGTINSAQAGVEIRINATLLLQGVSNETYTKTVTTDGSGNFTAT